MTASTPFPVPGALDPRAPFPPGLCARLERAWIHPAREAPWWQASPHMGTDRVAAYRAEMLAALDRVERVHGPPKRGAMLHRLEFEARHDRAMPAWLHRPWFVPGPVMLAVDALFEGLFGTGYTAFGTGRAGEDALGRPPGERFLWLLVKPVPGAIQATGRDGRDALAAEAARSCAGLGLPNVRINVWNDTEPAKAYLGVLVGEVIREGHVRLGIPREYGRPEDWDNF